MQVHLSCEAERIAREQVQRGHFGSPESALDEALRLLQKNGSLESAPPRERLRRKICEQGIVPLADGTELYGDFWPEEETMQEFIAFLAELRTQTDLRGQRLQEMCD